MRGPDHTGRPVTTGKTGVYRRNAARASFANLGSEKGLRQAELQAGAVFRKGTSAAPAGHMPVVFYRLEN
ncbi:hypothetical protein RA210_U40036 [Rubrivivax sp. A210]|nr:hypothetical protein RA210_U40036 [Rubrivivax sp. A210]